MLIVEGMRQGSKGQRSQDLGSESCSRNLLQKPRMCQGGESGMPQGLLSLGHTIPNFECPPSPARAQLEGELPIMADRSSCPVP